jgi:hypothetical protein
MGYLHVFADARMPTLAQCLAFRPALDQGDRVRTWTVDTKLPTP